jgi:hypothetical protein
MIKDAGEHGRPSQPPPPRAPRMVVAAVPSRMGTMVDRPPDCRGGDIKFLRTGARAGRPARKAWRPSAAADIPSRQQGWLVSRSWQAPEEQTGREAQAAEAREAANGPPVQDVRGRGTLTRGGDEQLAAVWWRWRYQISENGCMCRPAASMCRAVEP